MNFEQISGTNTGPGQNSDSAGYNVSGADTGLTSGFRFSEEDEGSPVSIPGLGNNVAPKVFESHELAPVHSDPVLLEKNIPDWFTVVLLIVMAGLTWIRVFYYKIFRQLFAAFASNLVSNQVVRDENILVQRASILLSFIFYLSSSLFIYLISVYFNWDYPLLATGFLRYMIIALLVAFIYSFKMVLLKGLGEIFKISKPVATYIFNIFLINNILGLALIPVVITAAYVARDSTGTVLYMGMVLVIIAFIYRFMRAVRIWMSMQGVSLFYLFLYFCTLEIAPLVVLVKIAGGI